MMSERIDAVWIEERLSLTIDELGERWGLSRAQLTTFIEHGVLEPDASHPAPAGFTLESLPAVRTACRLQEELDLEPHAVGVVLQLLQRVQALEGELRALRAALAADEAASAAGSGVSPRGQASAG
jgi:hypothetical protein